MEQPIHEIAEQLERKRLNALRLNLSGFFMAGATWILNNYLFHSDHFMIWVILGLGAFIWALSLVLLVRVKLQVNRSQELKQLFHDELSALNQLKTWKVGFIVVLVTLISLFLISWIIDLNPRFILESTLFMAVISVVAASIVLEEMLAITVFQDEFDTDKYEIWSWKHILFFHWILNPGVVFNELVLGQRIPKIMLIGKENGRVLYDKNYVPCPHCGTIHDSKTWVHHNGTAFGHWFGMYCPNCGGIIPCLQNISSYIILALTYPIRAPFLKAAKRRWLAKQPKRYENLDLGPLSMSKVKWPFIGLMFGIAMFIIMSFIIKIYLYLIDRPDVDLWTYILDLEFLAISLVIWLLAGIGFGYLMKYFTGPKSPFGRMNKAS